MNINKEKVKGVGYQESRKRRKKLFEHTKAASTQIELEGNEEYHLYMGRAHIKDFISGTEARGLLKIGRGKFVTAIQRGRNQPGVDFRIYAMIEFNNNAGTWAAERVVKDMLAEHHVKGPQGQRELYNLKDADIKVAVGHITQELKRRGISIKNTKLWL